LPLSRPAGRALAGCAPREGRGPDFADGFTRPGYTGNVNPTPPSGEEFAAVSVQLDNAVDPNVATVTFQYAGADPAEVSQHQFDPFPFFAAPGSLRIWTKSGSQQRDQRSANDDGTYVVPGEAYRLSDLGGAGGTVALWLEGIAATSAPAEVRVQLDPDGPGPAGAIASDAALLNVIWPKVHWQRAALNKAGISAAAWNPDFGFTHNRSIVEGVYAYYTASFNAASSKLLWAGLGKLAGGTVQRGDGRCSVRGDGHEQAAPDAAVRAERLHLALHQ
jgi:hypothetical protein